MPGTEGGDWTRPYKGPTGTVPGAFGAPGWGKNMLVLEEPKSNAGGLLGRGWAIASGWGGGAGCVSCGGGKLGLLVSRNGCVSGSG